MRYATLAIVVVPSLAFAAVEQPPKKTEQCRVVHGRYRIYANHDLLWIAGSKHLLEVVIDELDSELTKRGWEKTSAYGDFKLCVDKIINPQALTISNSVRVAEFSNIRFVTRP